MTVSAAHLRQAAEQVLQTNMPGALSRLEDEWDITLPPVASWLRLADFLDITDSDSPAITITTPGLAAPPVPQEGGGYRVPWLLRTYVVVRGRTYEETSDRVGHYLTAVRLAYLTDPTLGGLAVDVPVWRDENQRELGRDNQRTVQAGSTTFAFTVPVDNRLSVPATLAEVTTGLLPVPVHPAL